MTSLPAEVLDRTGQYLDAVDEALPGFVTALYVVGSAALGAWQPGYSDIDTMIVTARPATADDFAALEKLHAAMPDAPKFDGVYLDEAAFAQRPSEREVVPFVVNGEFRTDRPCGELNPAVWLILQRYGVAVRGPDVEPRPIPDLRRFNLDNLRSYWQPLAGQIREHVAEMPGDAPFDAELVVWGMLGPARLHHTLATGDIVSKSGSAAYLAEHFPAWADLAERAARWRGGEPVEFTVKDLLDSADSIDAIVTDAWQRFGEPSQ